MENLFDLKDKVVVITGGGGVLGRTMSKYMCEQGAKVVIMDRCREAGRKLIEELNSDGLEAYCQYTDVLDAELIKNSAQEVFERYGRVDVLINGAGGNMAGATIGPDQTIFDLEIEAFRKVVDLNLFGTVMPSIEFAKIMVKHGKGSIINISSESAIRPLTRVVGYSAAKAAVTNFTKFLATEMATKFSEGIRVNAMAPGFFLTEQNRALMTNPDGSLTARGETIIKHTPFGRFGEPDELLGTLHYLASDASKFVTGTMIVIDGGFDAFAI